MITVYTCITGEKDNLIEDHIKGEAKFIAYLDSLQFSNIWEVKKAYDKFIDPRRNSRIQKILSHEYINSEYSIYLDGNIRLLKSPEELIEKHLKNHDIAVYKHPNRDCIYDEAMICATRGLDDPEIIIEQAKNYEDGGYAKHKGLAECGVIFRRNTEKVKQLNKEWWCQFTRYSRRDQISFMKAVDEVGIRVNLINDLFIDKTPNLAIKQSGDLEIVTHKHYV